MAQNFVSLPSAGASGGILIAVSDRFFKLQNPRVTANTISATITMLAENIDWSITGVYGPQADNEKILFMKEIADPKQQMLPAWLLLGDFNLIYRAEEKNNGRLNLPMLSRFKTTIDNLLLAPFDLRGKKYTWCNDQQSPTITKIDHLFATGEWLDIFPRTDLHALASIGSDHCPLLHGDVVFDFYRGFRFEASWTRCPGFSDAVQEAWNKPVLTQDAILWVHVKLLQTAKALKNWRRKQFSGWKLSWATK
jgi:hypothetical protein